MARLGWFAVFLAFGMAVKAQDHPAPEEIRRLAGQAYVFAYPMVLTELTRRTALERPAIPGTRVNAFAHAPQFPSPAFRQIVRPNADTLYSTGWLDLSAAPVLVHVPDTGGRYYVLQLMDAWTETFAAPGKRTTGTGEGWFAITGPDWKGKLPERAQEIKAPTNNVWLLGRVQTNGVSDYGRVHEIQKGMVLMPLGQYPDGPQKALTAAPKPPAGPAVTPPDQAAALSPDDFFRLFVQLLQHNPPHPEDRPMMQNLARLGIEPGKYRPELLDEAGRKAFAEAVISTRDRLAAVGRTPVGKPRNGWTGFAGPSSKIGRYGTDYLSRAYVARIGLGANPPEDAVYLNCQVDREGKSLNGTNHYVIHFAATDIPPVKAFWSLTMYDTDGYFVVNPIERYAIGDRDALRKNPDGSLDLVLQQGEPEEGIANWLPAPRGDFALTLRLYWPEETVLNGKWIPPAVEKKP